VFNYKLNKLGYIYNKKYGFFNLRAIRFEPMTFVGSQDAKRSYTNEPSPLGFLLLVFIVLISFNQNPKFYSQVL